jgi:hypothetical protein
MHGFAAPPGNSPSGGGGEFHAERGKAETMGNLNVLLVGKSASQYSLLEQRLTSWGGKCQFAVSHGEVRGLLVQKTIGLVISEMKLVDGSALRMMPLVKGSPTSLFSFHATANGCLWIPIVEKGRICLGEPALQPREFTGFLRQALAEGHAPPPLECQVIELPPAPLPSPPQTPAKPRVFAKAG